MSVIERMRGAFAVRVKRSLAQNRTNPIVRNAMSICESLLNGYHNLNYFQWENGEFWLLSTLASFPLSCFIDAGANVGDWTAEVKKNFPAATIHSFEILPKTFASLSKNTAGLSGVNLVNCGLSDRSGDLQLHCFEGHSGLTSAVDFPHPEQFQHTAIDAHVITGDSYIAENSIEHVDFLKIDVEGMEDKVLGGFEETIRRGAIDMIQFEYGLVNIQTHFLLRDFYEHLESRGYALGKIYPEYVDFRPYSFDAEDFRGPNYLAVLKSKTAYIQRLGKHGRR
jgi:FkbM family methyltransferase